MLTILDAIGPFFLFNKDKVTNWSKIPFLDLEKDGVIDQEKEKVITENFKVFLSHAKKMGVNFISLDDMAHLVNFSFYSRSSPEKKIFLSKVF